MIPSFLVRCRRLDYCCVGGEGAESTSLSQARCKNGGGGRKGGRTLATVRTKLESLAAGRWCPLHQTRISQAGKGHKTSSKLTPCCLGVPCWDQSPAFIASSKELQQQKVRKDFCVLEDQLPDSVYYIPIIHKFNLLLVGGSL